MGQRTSRLFEKARVILGNFIVMGNGGEPVDFTITREILGTGGGNELRG